MKTQKTHCKYVRKGAIQGYGFAISAWKEGMKWWNQGSLRRHKCNVRRNNIRVSPVYRVYPTYRQIFEYIVWTSDGHLYGWHWIEGIVWIESLGRGNCLVGNTGLKPGAIERVRSPQRLRIVRNAVGLKVPPQRINTPPLTLVTSSFTSTTSSLALVTSSRTLVTSSRTLVASC